MTIIGKRVGMPDGTLASGRWRSALTQVHAILRISQFHSLCIKALYDVRLYRRCEMHFNNFDPNSDTTTSRIPVTCASLERHQLNDYLALRPDQSRAEIEHRLDTDHYFSAAWHDGRMIAVVWGGGGRVPLPFLSCDLELAPDVYYGYDNYVQREFRGYQVIGSLLNMRHRYLSKTYPRSIGVIWTQNPAAMRRRAKHGHPVFGAVGYYGIGRWRRYFFHVDSAIIDPVHVPGQVVRPA